MVDIMDGPLKFSWKNEFTKIVPANQIKLILDSNTMNNATENTEDQQTKAFQQFLTVLKLKFRDQLGSGHVELIVFAGINISEWIMVEDLNDLKECLRMTRQFHILESLTELSTCILPLTERSKIYFSLMKAKDVANRRDLESDISENEHDASRNLHTTKETAKVSPLKESAIPDNKIMSLEQQLANQNVSNTADQTTAQINHFDQNLAMKLPETNAQSTGMVGSNNMQALASVSNQIPANPHQQFAASNVSQNGFQMQNQMNSATAPPPSIEDIQNMSTSKRSQQGHPQQTSPSGVNYMSQANNQMQQQQSLPQQNQFMNGQQANFMGQMSMSTGQDSLMQQQNLLPQQQQFGQMPQKTLDTQNNVPSMPPLVHPSQFAQPPTATDAQNNMMFNTQFTQQPQQMGQMPNQPPMMPPQQFSHQPTYFP